MPVIELLRFGADGVHDAWKNPRKRSRVSMKGIERICPSGSGVVRWIGILVLDESPCIQRHLSARGDAEWEDFLFEERPNVELLGVSEIGEAKEEAGACQAGGAAVAGEARCM